MVTPKHNYDEDLAFAIDMLQEYGRQVTFVRYGGASSDDSKPWRTSDNPRADIAESVTVDVAAVEPESLERLSKQRQTSGNVKSAEQVLIAASTTDLGLFDEMIDTDGSVWLLHNTQLLSPAGTHVLQYVRVQRRGKVTAVRGALL